MKNILIIETSAFRGRGGGGSFIQAQYYRDLLLKKKYNASIFIGSSDENNNHKKLKVIKRLKQADYVIGFGTPLLCSYLQWLCFIFGKKGIFCIDTYISSKDIISDHLRRRMFPAKIIFSTILSSLLNKFFTFFLPPKLNLVTFPSCRYILDKLRFTRLKHDSSRFLYPRISFKKRDRVPEAIKNIVFYGTLYRGRGVVDLLRACRLLWKKGYIFKLLILGFPVDSYTRTTLLKSMRKEDKKRIIFKEKVERIIETIRKATAVVLPFRYPCSFQTPYTLLEPMGLGIPVITTDVGSHKEWIKHKITGLFCRRENIQDIAEKIELIFNNEALVKKITNNAYKLLEERYEEKDSLLDTLENLSRSAKAVIFSFFIGNSLNMFGKIFYYESQILG